MSALLGLLHCTGLDGGIIRCILTFDVQVGVWVCVCAYVRACMCACMYLWYLRKCEGDIQVRLVGCFLFVFGFVHTCVTQTAVPVTEYKQSIFLMWEAGGGGGGGAFEHCQNIAW